jgi:hypothetical protein
MAESRTTDRRDLSGTLATPAEQPTRAEAVAATSPAPLAQAVAELPLVSAVVEPPGGIEPPTPSLPWNHQEPLCGRSFSQVARDRRGQS